jgi:phenylalanyl-tRNA synthetase beta chain
MKVLTSWLQEYLGEKLSAHEMAERLEKSGIEIEQIISSQKLDKNIKVGLVNKVAQHPNADRLKLAEISLGKAKLNIVCGAPNLEVGQKVAVATVGTVLPDGTQIKKSEIRGKESEGMICSAAELGVSDDHSGIMVLPHDYPLNATLCDMWDSGEILDLTTAANRGDLQSVIGLAREIAARGTVQPKIMWAGELAAKSSTKLVKNVDENKVTRYALVHIKIGKVSESPQWLQDRLLASSVRPINAVVDITNYVMLEYGQPLHAFDALRVALPISVRPAKAQESLITLDGQTRKLTHADLVIADSKGAIGIAGVMGGQESEIRENTREILLEAAVFDGTSIRKTAVRNGLRTDASARFERGIPALLPALALARAVELLKQLADAEVLAMSDHGKKIDKTHRIELKTTKVTQLLQVSIADNKIVQKLGKLGFAVEKSKHALEVSVPWWRRDIKIEEDLIEEVGRLIGYDGVPATLPLWRGKAINFDQRWSFIWRVKDLMRSLGLFEVVTYSFVSSEQLTDFGFSLDTHLKLKNPMSIEQAYLRSRLLPSLVTVASKNSRYSKDFGLFELSKVYVSDKDHSKQPHEPYNLGIVRRTGYQGVKAALDLLARELGVEFDVLPKANQALHPLRSAEVILAGKVVGIIGEVRPDILAKYKISGELGYLELNLGMVRGQSGTRAYQEISKFPSITRDLAIVVPENALWSQINHIVADLGVAKVEFLNDYRGKDLPAGTKSVALRLTFSSMERTLKDEEADAGVKKALAALTKTLGAKERKS